MDRTFKDHLTSIAYANLYKSDVGKADVIKFVSRYDDPCNNGLYYLCRTKKRMRQLWKNNKNKRYILDLIEECFMKHASDWGHFKYIEHYHMKSNFSFIARTIDYFNDLYDYYLD